MSGTKPMAGGPDDPDDLARTQASSRPLPPDLPDVPGVTLQCEIARGGMGVVYSGRQDFLDRRVAVKLLSLDLAGEGFAQRFQREAKILAGIKHPNIVACHMAGTTDEGQSYLVMEYIDGPTLKHWVGQNGPLPVAAALRTTRLIASALAHAFTLGIIHRDVKPENILLESLTSTAIDLTFPYVPKVVDLGLARNTDANLALTSPGSVMGTPATMSPEQFDEPDAVDFRTDIYGLGCVLYEMLVGRPAFPSRKLTELVAQKRAGAGPNPCRENGRVPAGIGQLVSDMLHTDRNLRPASYGDLIERIEGLLTTLTPDETSGPKAPIGIETEYGGRPTQPRKSQPPVSAQPGTPSGGPGLLKTGELNFLAEGLGGPIGGAKPADGDLWRTKVPGGPAPGPAPAPAPVGGEGAFATFVTPGQPSPQSSPAPSPVAATRRGGGRGKLIALAAVVAAVVVAAFVAMRGKDPVDPGAGPGTTAPLTPAGTAGDAPANVATTPPVPANRAPTVPGITGPDEIAVGRNKTPFAVAASDPDGDRLTYSWSIAPEEAAVLQTTDKPEVLLTVLKAMPDLAVTLRATVSDGNGHATTVERAMTVAVAEPDQPLQRLRSSGSDWEIPTGQLVRWKEELEGGGVSALTVDGPVTASHALPDGSLWRVEGALLPSSTNSASVQSVTTARIEFDDRGLAVVATRRGAQGAEWTIELCDAERVDGAWQVKSRQPACRVTWEYDSLTSQDSDEREPYFICQRLGDRITTRIGCKKGNELKPLQSLEVALPADVRASLTLQVENGRGVFRRFLCW